MRKPLYQSELGMAPSQITVTGAESYIGGAVIERLLAAGHTVHATWRGKDQSTVQHLLTMKNAAAKLKLYQADLLVSGSFLEPLAGSRYLVHIASPCDMYPPPGKANELLIKPAVFGVENVLTSALDTPSLEKVVVTSSVGAVVGSKKKLSQHHLHDEADWNEEAAEDFQPYSRSKVLAEQRAYEIAAQPECKWDLVTICPAIVQGPPTGKIKCQSTNFMVKLLKGFYYPMASPVGMPFVDVDDVAAAHCLALATPEATGRFVIGAESMLLPDYVNLLKPKYAAHKLPYIFWIPFFIVYLVIYIWFMDKGFDLDMMSTFYKRPPLLSNEKSRTVLGLRYMNMRDTALDMADATVKLGFLQE